MAAVIETDGLTKVYGRQAAVDGLCLSVNEGEIFGFLGPNGAGKTTSLLMLLGLTEPSSGQALNPHISMCGVRRTADSLACGHYTLKSVVFHWPFYGACFLAAWRNNLQGAIAVNSGDCFVAEFTLSSSKCPLQ